MNAPRPTGFNDLPEAEAIRLAQQGDAAAFERLYRLHSARVFALCLRMLKNLAEAEDATQEIFLQVFCKIHAFRGASAFSTWLYRVAVNSVLMRLRRKTLAKTSLDEITEAGESAGAASREPGARDQRLEGYIDRLALRRAIDQLPPGCRTMFVLYDIQGYAHREIAKLAGCSVGNAKSQLHNARRRLRELLRHETSRAAREIGRSTPNSVDAAGTPFLRPADESKLA